MRKKRGLRQAAANPAGTMLSPPRQKPRRARPLPPRQARPRAHRLRHGGRGCTGPAARERFECPKDARNAAWGRRRRISPGHACCPSRQGSRRARPLLSRQARPRAHRARRAPAPAPQPAPRKRFERPSDARNAAWGRRWRMPPGLPPAPAVRGLEGRSPPKCIRIARLRRAGGEFAPLGANIPYAGRRPASRRQSRRRSRRTAHPPAEKIGASRAFPTRSYSILASASLTSSIRRATWEGVSTGWLNSTVWFTVTGAAACVCAASRS